MTAITSHDRRLLALILDPIPFADLLERSGLAIDQLLDWADSPPIRRLLERLQRFADLRTGLTAAHAGPAAASTLAALLQSSDNPVEQRRLANTLLRAGRPTRPSRSRNTAGEQPSANAPANPTSDRPSAAREDPPAPQRNQPPAAARRAGNPPEAQQQLAPAPVPHQPQPAPTPPSHPMRLPPTNPRIASLTHRAGTTKLPRAG